MPTAIARWGDKPSGPVGILVSLEPVVLMGSPPPVDCGTVASGRFAGGCAAPSGRGVVGDAHRFPDEMLGDEGVEGDEDDAR